MLRELRKGQWSFLCSLNSEHFLGARQCAWHWKYRMNKRYSLRLKRLTCKQMVITGLVSVRPQQKSSRAGGGEPLTNYSSPNQTSAHHYSGHNLCLSYYLLKCFKLTHSYPKKNLFLKDTLFHYCRWKHWHCLSWIGSNCKNKCNERKTMLFNCSWMHLPLECSKPKTCSFHQC